MIPRQTTTQPSGTNLNTFTPNSVNTPVIQAVLGQKVSTPTGTATFSASSGGAFQATFNYNDGRSPKTVPATVNAQNGAVTASDGESTINFRQASDAKGRPGIDALETYRGSNIGEATVSGYASSNTAALQLAASGAGRSAFNGHTVPLNEVLPSEANPSNLLFQEDAASSAKLPGVGGFHGTALAEQYSASGATKISASSSSDSAISAADAGQSAYDKLRFPG